MDGNNFYNNNENNNVQQNNNNAQFSNQPNNNYYQDNTAYVPYQQPVNNGADNKANGLQIAGLVCGILGICGACCYAVPGLIFSIIGLICSILGNKKNKHGIGVAGLVCSIVGLIFSVAMAIYWGFCFVLALQMIESGEVDISNYSEIMEYMQKYYN